MGVLCIYRANWCMRRYMKTNKIILLITLLLCFSSTTGQSSEINCDKLLKQYATFYNNGNKPKARVIKKIILAQCIYKY
jgi:hypothetical protein